MMTGVVPGVADAITVVAATATEARPVRRRLRDVPGVRVEIGGIRASRWRPSAGATVLSCGLAGGLDESVPTGSLVIPDVVGVDGGIRYACDDELVARLRAAARECGLAAHPGPLLSVGHVVSGVERRLWAARGYAAADMESGVLARLAGRFAVVRVVLDTPQREISPAWHRPARAIARPRLWGQALWMARFAPGQCDVAARVVAEALSSPPSAQARGTSEPPARPAG